METKVIKPGMEHYYILFENHTDGIEMYDTLKGEGMYAQVSPTPRQLSVCCGISLLVKEEDIPNIIKLAEDKALHYMTIEGLNNTFDNKRHKYG